MYIVQAKYDGKTIHAHFGDKVAAMHYAVLSAIKYPLIVFSLFCGGEKTVVFARKSGDVFSLQKRVIFALSQNEGAHSNTPKFFESRIQLREYDYKRWQAFSV